MENTKQEIEVPAIKDILIAPNTIRVISIEPAFRIGALNKKIPLSDSKANRIRDNDAPEEQTTKSSKSSVEEKKRKTGVPHSEPSKILLSSPTKRAKLHCDRNKLLASIEKYKHEITKLEQEVKEAKLAKSDDAEKNERAIEEIHEIEGMTERWKQGCQEALSRFLVVQKERFGDAEGELKLSSILQGFNIDPELVDFVADEEDFKQ